MKMSSVSNGILLSATELKRNETRLRSIGANCHACIDVRLTARATEMFCRIE